MTKLFRAVDTAADTVFPPQAPLRRNLTLGDAQAALNRVNGIRLTVGLLRQMPALAAVIERGGSALLPAKVLSETAISTAATSGIRHDREAEAFAIVGVALTYGRATGEIGKGRDAARQLSILLDAEGLRLTALGPELGQ